MSCRAGFDLVRDRPVDPTVSCSAMGTATVVVVMTLCNGIGGAKLITKRPVRKGRFRE